MGPSRRHGMKSLAAVAVAGGSVSRQQMYGAAPRSARSEADLARLFAWAVRSGSPPREAGSPTVPSGCTDSLATNYDARALAENGACEYGCARLAAHYFRLPGRGGRANRTMRCFMYNQTKREWCVACAGTVASARPCTLHSMCAVTKT